MSENRFKMGDLAKIKASGETGEVIGIAQHAGQAAPQYLLRYAQATGNAVEAWWEDAALTLT